MKRKLIFPVIIVLMLLVGAIALSVGVFANDGDLTPKLEVNGANVEFGDSVHLIYSVGYENVESPENIKLLVWRESDGISADQMVKGTEGYVLSPMVNPPEGLFDNSVAFMVTDVAAAEMTENIYVRAYYAHEGETVYSPVQKYSVLQYAMNKLGVTGVASENELLKNMLKSMLVYGADAQKYFGVNLDRLATDSYVKIKVDGTTFADGTSSMLAKVGEEITLTANVTDALPYAVFTDEEGKVLSTNSVYTFTAEKNMTVSVTLSAKSSALIGAFDGDAVPDAFLDFDGDFEVAGKNHLTSDAFGTTDFGKGYNSVANGSAYFGGENYATLGDLKLGTDDFSVALWVNPTNLTYETYLRYKIPLVSTAESYNRAVDGMSIFIDIENGAFVVTLGDSEAENGMNANYYFFTPTSPKATSNADRYVGKPEASELENKWTHFIVVMERSTGTLRIFMDFEEVFTTKIKYFGTSTAIPANVSADSYPFTVGSYGTINTSERQTSLSYVDDLAVFKRSVTDEDVLVMKNYYSALALDHTFLGEWSYNDDTHWHEATCGHKVKGSESEHFIGADGACVSNCGYHGEPPHVHTFSEEWSMDEVNHWRESSCGHDLVVEFGEHSYGNDGLCTSCGFNRKLVITSSDIEQGGWSYGNKNGASAQRIRVSRLIPVKAGTVIDYNLNGMELYLDLADGIGATTGTRSGWLKGTGSYVISTDCYLGITLAAGGRSTDVTPSDFSGVYISLTLGENKDDGKISKLNVYRFGGEGNDWCFVYLPEGYDPGRAEPYPFVIANHGNGWNMNGSYQMANWTNISQYLPASEIALQPESLRSRFIETDDPTLYYSNPTIEALLDAGYIVCGAQNYGDGLYGNDNCANACVAFFNHMTETYNVEDSCYMIGASNGAMTTLNAAAKLGEKVKSIILQYPLTSIITHYEAGNHQDGIESAYGLDTSKVYTTEELKSLLSEYDPLYNNVEDGVKVGYFPSVKIYYSMTDTTTPAEANALPLIAMLDKSGITYEGVQVDSDGGKKQHGHIDHFDPEGFVEWFNNH